MRCFVQEFQTTKNESASSGFEVKTVDSGTVRAAALRQPDAALGRVVENRVLTKPGAQVKRHIGTIVRLCSVPANSHFMPQSSNFRRDPARELETILQCSF